MEAYLTYDELKASASGVGLNQLIKDGHYADQAAAAALKIAAASAWCSSLCYQSLIASQRTDTVTVQSCSYMLVLNPRAWKVPMHLDEVWVGTNGSDLTQVSDISTAWVEHGLFKIPRRSIAGAGPLVKFTYTAGFPNTAVAADAAATSTEITVVDPTGINPGDTLTIPDGENTESVSVASIAGSVLTLNSALLGSHGSGVVVHGMPANVKEAAVQATMAFLRKGGSSVVMPASGGTTTTQSIVEDHLAKARDLLADYVMP